jgi:hypothetical protein
MLLIVQIALGILLGAFLVATAEKWFPVALQAVALLAGIAVLAIVAAIELCVLLCIFLIGGTALFVGWKALFH